jgi:DUF1009 family protein
MGTLEQMRAARAKILAVEADKTIFIDQESIQRAANHYGITIVATKMADLQLPRAAAA